MDDFLYTLFVIAWIAYGIYKGVKKSKPADKRSKSDLSRSNQEKSSKKLNTTFESVFSEVFDIPLAEDDKMSHPYAFDHSEKIQEKQPVYENYATNDVLDSYKGSDNVSSVFEVENSDDTEDENSNKIFDNQMEEEGVKDEKPIFDLRQAIIHQVILERKY